MTMPPRRWFVPALCAQAIAGAACGGVPRDRERPAEGDLGTLRGQAGELAERLEKIESRVRHALYCVGRSAVQALRGHRGERTPALALERADGPARVVVEDSGPGIAPDDHPRVFEPFFTTNHVGQGSGPGLAISAGVAEEHGGTPAPARAPAPSGGVRTQLVLRLSPTRNGAGNGRGE